MAYSITVYNTRRIGEIDPQDILTAVTASNYHTLCDQYGLDPSMIKPTLACLKIVARPRISQDYFILKYRPENRRPIIVHFLEPAMIDEGELERVRESIPQAFQEKLRDTKQIVLVELSEDQLSDLGLLLGYELARWAAGAGDGVIRALDGKWYRLNRHKAFLPVA